MGKRTDLGFVIQKEIDKKHSEIKLLEGGLSKISLFNDSDINDIFSTDRRDGVRSRFKRKLRLF